MKQYFNLFFLALVLWQCTNDQSQVTIENDDLLVTINSEGAELQSIINKASGEEYLWQGDPAYWAKRSPVMFPVNVRFRENRYTYRGEDYEMPRMGLAIEAPFTAEVAQTGEQVVMLMSSNEGTLQYYPFPFRLAIKYELIGQKLINRFELENTGKDTMYFALGGHPGFRFPAATRANCAYTFSEKMNVTRIEIAESLVQHRQIPFLVDEDRLRLNDTRVPANGSGMFLRSVSAREIGLGVAGQPPFISVDLGDFPNVNLWSPPASPYACIEPMLSHHDLVDASLAIEDKEHLIALGPGELGTYQYTIIVHRKN